MMTGTSPSSPPSTSATSSNGSGPSSPVASSNSNGNGGGFRRRGIWLLGALCVIIQLTNIRSFRGALGVVKESISWLEAEQQQATGSVSRFMAETETTTLSSTETAAQQQQQDSNATAFLQEEMSQLKRKHLKLTTDMNLLKKNSLKNDAVDELKKENEKLAGEVQDLKETVRQAKEESQQAKEAAAQAQRDAKAGSAAIAVLSKQLEEISKQVTQAKASQAVTAADTTISTTEDKANTKKASSQTTISLADDKTTKSTTTRQAKAIVEKTAASKTASADAATEISAKTAATTTRAAATTNKEAEGIVPTPVVFMPYSHYKNYDVKEKLTESHDKNYFQNGIEESPFIELVHFNDTARLILEDKPVSWIWDTSRLRPKGACNFMKELIKKVMNQVWQERPNSKAPTWHIGFSDTRDHGWEIYECPEELDQILKNMSKTIPYWKRGMVTQRSFNTTTGKVNPGKLHGNIQNLPAYKGQTKPSPTLKTMPLYHSPINVRTDMVEALANLLATPKYQHATLSSPIESMWERPRDVAHFFPASLKGYKDEAPMYAKLRMAVSQTILDFGKTQTPTDTKKKKYNVLARLVGQAKEKGRRSPQQEYLEELLKTKIVVVAQRDPWEDHWRLFEAMISGAMIITDRILAMPSGLAHGESIVVFSNLEQFKKQLKFYLKPENEEKRLAIAKKGRYIAMSQHRSWHRMEEIALGEVKSTCANSKFPECPYTVHAT